MRRYQAFLLRLWMDTDEPARQAEIRGVLQPAGDEERQSFNSWQMLQSLLRQQIERSSICNSPQDDSSKKESL